MEKELGLKQLMTENSQYMTEYNYSYPNSYVAAGRRLQICISRSKCDLILNPVIIMELDETSDLEFDAGDIFAHIELVIGCSQIDKLYSNQLKIYQVVKGYGITKIGSKIFYPLPFDSFDADNGFLSSKCDHQEIRLGIEFTSNPCVNTIKEMCLRTDAIVMEHCPDYGKISNYYINNSKNINTVNTNLLSSLEKYLDDADNQIVKNKQLQFGGIYGLSNQLSNQISNQKFRTNFNHIVEKIFIYFENRTNASIYKLRPFDKITLVSNGYNVIEYDYETLVHDGDEKITGCKLPRGVYQIDLKKLYSLIFSCIDNFIIELSGISIPNNDIGLCVCANSINYMRYNNHLCGLFYCS